MPKFINDVDSEHEICYFCNAESVGYSMIKQNGIENNLPTCKDHEV